MLKLLVDVLEYRLKTEHKYMDMADSVGYCAYCVQVCIIHGVALTPAVTRLHVYTAFAV